MNTLNNMTKPDFSLIIAAKLVADEVDINDLTKAEACIMNNTVGGYRLRDWFLSHLEQVKSKYHLIKEGKL